MEVEFINSTARMTAVKTDKAKKIDGKNSRGGSSYNGFYTFSGENNTSCEYFVKVPKQATEFFFEALAARIIAKFRHQGILKEEYGDLFVVTRQI
ncbi:hypothetical protein [Caedibacter taeniospiralis]|jgi:hypothetical protein|uniref:hypothetical protein n=1 Tax=Caedibacter taeniospiralis TaxID=28907 RepID=UPI0037C08F1F